MDIFNTFDKKNRTMNLSTRQLRVFEATTRLGRLTLAAKEQALSQSAASQSLKELEQVLGYSLFTRLGRALKITDEGTHILPKIRQILALVDTLTTPASNAISGPLRIGASITIASFILPQITATLLERYPGISPEIQINNTEAVIHSVEKGQVHIGLIEGPSSSTTLNVTPWRQDTLALFCRPDHPLAQTGHITKDDINQHRWVLRELGSGTRTVFDLAVQRIGARVQSSLSLNRQEAIKQSVKAGLGIGCLSELSIKDELASGHFITLQSPMNLNRRFAIVTDDTNNEHPVIMAFLALIQEQQTPLDHNISE